MKSDMKWPESFRGTGKTSIWGNSFFLKDGPGKFHEASDAIGAENYCPWGPSVGDLNADGFDDAFIASGMNYPERYMINSVKLNDRGQQFVDAEFLLGIEPRQGGVATPWFELDASGKDKAIPTRPGATGRVAIWGARAHALGGHLRSRRRRRSRHRHQRVQRRADGARQQPEREDARALRRGEADRHDVESRRPGRGGQGDGRRIDYTKVYRRQLRLSVAQPVSAVLRARRSRRGRQHRGGVAVGQEADRAVADQDQFDDRGARAVTSASGFSRKRQASPLQP